MLGDIMIIVIGLFLLFVLFLWFFGEYPSST